MQILKEQCIGCRSCVVYCPMRAISIQDDIAEIDGQRCVECGVCSRVAGCPTDALFQEETLDWPRSIRSILSNPLTEYVETGVTGRGTEEMKTNDVTDRFKLGEVGFAIDVGRPNIGTTIAEIEKISKVLASLGIVFEKDNPITSLIEDPQKGTMKEEVKNEMLMSGIIEFKVPREMMLLVLSKIKEVSRDLETVFTLGVISKIDEKGEIPILDELIDSGWQVRPNGKTTVGLGRGY